MILCIKDKTLYLFEDREQCEEHSSILSDFSKAEYDENLIFIEVKDLILRDCRKKL